MKTKTSFALITSLLFFGQAMDCSSQPVPVAVVVRPAIVSAARYLGFDAMVSLCEDGVKTFAKKHFGKFLGGVLLDAADKELRTAIGPEIAEEISKKIQEFEEKLPSQLRPSVKRFRLKISPEMTLADYQGELHLQMLHMNAELEANTNLIGQLERAVNSHSTVLARHESEIRALQTVVEELREADRRQAAQLNQHDKMLKYLLFKDQLRDMEGNWRIAESFKGTLKLHTSLTSRFGTDTELEAEEEGFKISDFQDAAQERWVYVIYGDEEEPEFKGWCPFSALEKVVD
jgi:hypothetical protein